MELDTTSLFDAWQTWFSGESVVHLELWGLSIQWWGRVGKFVALISAFAIVAEFLGPAKLRSLGTYLHEAFSAQAQVRQAIATYQWLFWIGVFTSLIPFRWIPRSHSMRSHAKGRITAYAQATVASRRWLLGAVAILIVGSVGLAVWATYEFALTELNYLDAIAITLLALALIWVFIGIPIVAFFPLLYLGLPVVLNLLIVEPFALLLDRADKGIKALSFGLLLVGFHFDLLAS